MSLSRAAVRSGYCKTSGLGGAAGPRADKPAAKRGNKPALSDGQILEARALHLFAGWTAAALAERYGASLDVAKRIAYGFTRPQLVPTRAHLPQDVGET